ncbi:MAG: ThuA domain-containing protein [Luminiphilus sp.]|nr:ThuA domain-containing protein [Luminiphilus sp.]
MKSSRQNLILVGGIFHDFQASAEALAMILAPLGIESRIEADLDAGIASLADNPVDLLTVNALRWEMIGEKYDPYREAEAYSPPHKTRWAIETHLQTGGALLGLHTASICFSDWPEWGSLLGGHWVWGTSFHPQPETVSVVPDRDNVLGDLPPFAVHDELYTDLFLEPGAQVLAHGHSAAMPIPQPIVWSHTVGAGRVIYNALGHDSESLQHPSHAQLLRETVKWALAEGDRQ